MNSDEDVLRARIRELKRRIGTYDNKEILVLKTDNKKLKARIQELEARLEIDHVWRSYKGDSLERVEIPPEDRDKQIDGIYCRDVTIEELETIISKKKVRIQELKAELAKLKYYTKDGQEKMCETSGYCYADSAEWEMLRGDRVQELETKNEKLREATGALVKKVQVGILSLESQGIEGHNESIFWHNLINDLKQALEDS